MGLGYRKCPDCGEPECDAYDVEYWGCCSACAKDRVEMLLHTVQCQRTEINRLKKQLREALQKGHEHEVGALDESNKAGIDADLCDTHRETADDRRGSGAA